MRTKLFRSSIILFLFLLPVMARANKVVPQKIFGLEIAADKAIWQAIEEAGDAKRHRGVPYVTVFDRQSTLMEQSGLSRVVVHKVLKVLSEAGAVKLHVLRFDYDPASSAASVYRVRIFRKSGKIEEVSLKNLRDLPQPQHMIYWGARTRLLNLPRLYVGDSVEMIYKRKGFIIAYLGKTSEDESRYIPPMRGHFYDVVYFIDKYPMMEKSYTLIVPRNKPIHYKLFHAQLGSSQRFTKTHIIYKWWKRNIPKHTTEPRMSAYGTSVMDCSDVVPKLVLATVPNWQTKSSWFFRINEPVFKANQAIIDKVKELLAGKKTDLEKVSTLLHWVADEIRYSGISMGKGEGYTIHPGIMTFYDRAGVCKDIAGMLITMLRVAGYTAYPAMTMAGARVEDIPADQFNHCVVALKKKDGSYWMLDPTWAPYSRELWSSAEQGQNYVIGSPKGEILMITPYVPPSKNYIRIKARSTLQADGSLKSHLFLTAEGYPDAGFRRILVYRPKRRRVQHFQRMLNRISPRVTLLSHSYLAPQDYRKPFELNLDYQAADYALTSDKIVVLRAPLAHHILVPLRRFTYHLFLPLPPKRKYRVVLRSTQETTFEEIITLPKNYKVLSLPKPQSYRSSVIDFDTSYTLLKDGSLRYYRTFKLKKKEFTAKEYPSFRKGMLILKKFDKARIYLQKVSKKSSQKVQKVVKTAPKKVQKLSKAKKVVKRTFKLRKEHPKFLAKFPTPSEYPKADIYIYKHSEVFKLDRKGLVTHRFYEAMNYFTPYAIDTYGDPHFTYNSRTQYIKTVKTRTFLPDGSIKFAKKNSFNPVLPSVLARAPGYADIKQLVVTHVGLERGATSELTLEIADKVKHRPYLWGEMSVQTDQPVGVYELTVSVPKGTTLHYACLGCEATPVKFDEKGQTIYRWQVKNVSARPWEGLHRHEAQSHYPRIIFSTAPSWNAIRLLLLKRFNEAQKVFSKALSGRIERLTEGKLDFFAKVRSLYRFATRGIESIHWPLKDFDYEMRSAAQVYNSAYGHALDKALLLAAMLNKVGIEATLAFFSYEMTDKSVPSLLQFPHLFVLVSHENRQYWLDPMSGKLCPENSHIVGKFLFDLRFAEPYVIFDNFFMEHGFRLFADLKLSSKALQGSFALHLLGQYNVYSKKFIASSLDASQVLKGVASRFGSVKNLKVQWWNPEKSTFSFDAKNKIPTANKEGYFFLRLPLLKSAYSLKKLQLFRQKRVTPLLLSHPIAEHSFIKLTFPKKGIKIITLPRSFEMKNRVGKLIYKVNYDVKKKKLIWERIFTISKAKISPKDYSLFRELYLAYMNPHQTRLLLKK